MGNILTQAQYLFSEVIVLLDEGKSITIEEFEEKMDNGTIIEFIGEKYGFKNLNSTPENQNIIKQELSALYVSENEAQKKCISNNGFVYLLSCLFEIVQSEAFDYKMNL